MARLFALADLHLSERGDKPMHVFGELWRDHASRMARNWDAAVAPEDSVLLAGDLSWARKLDEADEDLDWIAARPGRKLLLRGNHDSWWQSAGKVQRRLGEGFELLQGNALEWGEWVIVGARGWTAPGDPYEKEGDEKIYRRELERLRQSIDDAERRFDRSRPRLAMTHFPPRLAEGPPGDVVPILVEAGVRHCVFGHLHGDDHRLALSGEHEGIRFHFVAADAVDFTPVPIL